MQWLIQNWIPLAVGITFLVLMRRGGMCCGHRRTPPRQITPGDSHFNGAGHDRDATHRGR
jgi:hypothetical protein